jgi:hypothetical protein
MAFAASTTQLDRLVEQPGANALTPVFRMNHSGNFNARTAECV